ncbi:unnamed protein product, partial [Phyllotreta striolata]
RTNEPTKRHTHSNESAAYDNENFNGSTVTIAPEEKNYSNNYLVIEEDAHKSSLIYTVKRIVSSAKNRIKKGCTKKVLHKRLPILNWLPKYNASWAIGDFIAGITVGLTLIPQGLAYYTIIGLPPEYGLYSSFLGSFVYIFFGSCKDVPYGPSALNALLAAQSIKGKGPEHAILLCFLCGLIQIIMGLVGLGFIIDFVSGPVSSGFTSAAALIIVTSQVKDILGIRPKGSTFVETWTSIIHEFPNTRTWDAVMGFSCIFLLIVMKIIGAQKVGTANEKPSTYQKILNNVLWTIGTGRNAILVVICGCIGYIYCDKGDSPFLIIGDIPQGLPEIKPPPFGYETHVNGTTTYVSFFEMVYNLGSGIIIVPIVGILENIALCKAFAKGKPVDATQELIAIGLCNVGNSFVQGYAGTGALGRGAVNNASGVRTPFGGLYTGLLVIAALLFFTPYFYYIPNAVLGAVIIAATVFMVEVKVIKPLWRTKKSCFIIFIVTFVSCLVLRLEIGILIGIGINILLILYHSARPKISVEKLKTNGGIEYLLLAPDRCLIFPSVEYVRNLVTKHSIRQSVPVVLDCSHIYGADFTAATVVETLIKDFATRDQILFFYNLKPSVCSVFEGLSPKGFVVYYNPDDLDELLVKYIKGENVKRKPAVICTY